MKRTKKVSFLIAAENIIIEENSRKPSFIGVFDTLFIQNGNDSIFHTFHIGGKVLDIDGVFDTEIKLVHEETNDEIFSRKIYSQKLVGDVDIKVHVPLLSFKEGTYIIKFYIDNILSENNDFIFRVKKLVK